jgi:hypothetical protein
MRQNKIRVFLTLMTIVSILTLQARGAEAVPISRLVAPTAVDAGQSFNVDVFVDGVTAPDFILGFGFNVDSGSFVFGGATVSGAFDYDDSILLGLDVAGSDFPDPASFGDDEIYGDNILLATLNFTAPLSLGAGSYGLGISSVLGNFNEGLFTFNFDDLTVNTYDLSASTLIKVGDSGTAAVPEPSTLLLLCAGLSGLVGMRVRRRS